jgi:hypothetical protein
LWSISTALGHDVWSVGRLGCNSPLRGAGRWIWCSRRALNRWTS